MVGFEPLELYRILRDYGHESVRVVLNDRPFYPLESLQKKSEYPPLGQLISWIRTLAADLKIVKGTELAKEAGHPQAQNVVMVGAFAGTGWVPLEKSTYLRAVGQVFSGSTLDVNKKAFELGYEAVAQT
jgi:indolepyruvate ferredoxin oxidoreductase beta subunit